MSDVTQWTINGGEGLPIYGNTHLPGREVEPSGVLILCHGFKGYKDYGFFPRLAEQGAERGLIVHRFNFRHSGVTHRHETFAHPELFEQDTWSSQVGDVGRVMQGQGDGELTRWRHLPVVLFGHSRGGVTALLSGAALQSAEAYRTLRVRAGLGDPAVALAGVVSASAPARANNLDPEQERMLRRVGRLPSPSGRTGQDLYVGVRWLDEIDELGEELDPRRAAGYVRAPMLLLHGTGDDTVPAEAVNDLGEAAGARARVELIEGANHTMDAPNPMEPGAEVPATTRQFIERVVSFAQQRCLDVGAG